MAAKKSTKKAFQVVGPLATPYLEDGSRTYLYQGAQLPEGLREGEVERLVDLGLVAEVEVSEEPDTDAGAGA